MSPGTYIRALARDLGDRLGTGAHLTALRRTAIGDLRIEQAVPLAELSPETPLLPLLEVVGHLPRVALSDSEAVDIGHGRPVQAGSGAEIPLGNVILTHAGRLTAVAEFAGGMLRPEVVLESA